MATDMFLKIDGIEGESVDDKHPNEIELLTCLVPLCAGLD